MATLHRIPVSQGDIPSPAGGLSQCQWCNRELYPNDKVWECVGNLDHYIVCDVCHEGAIKH